MDRRLRFERPVVVRLLAGQAGSGKRRIADVNDGLAALHRYGLEALRSGGEPCREWRDAARALLTARAMPTPAAVASARQALSRAASLAGALAEARSDEASRSTADRQAV